MATVLVTGGAGFIGSHIADRFLKDGHKVEIIDNLSSGFKQNVATGGVLHEVDVRSKEAHQIIVAGAFDLIVHAAAQISVRKSMEDPMFDADVNVVGTVNLLEGSRRAAKLPRWIFISTGGAIYGEQIAFPANENHPIQPASLYGQTKRFGEMYLDFWRREFGLKYCVVRLANVYGPRQNPHGEAGVVAIFARTLLKGGTPIINGTGDQSRDFVFVGDVADAVNAAYQTGTEGIFNIGTSVETSVNALYHTLLKVVGSSTRAKYAGGKPGEQMRSVIDPTAAEKSFGWKAKVDLSSGLLQTVEWFKSNSL